MNGALKFSALWFLLWFSPLVCVYPTAVNGQGCGAWQWANPLPTASPLKAVTWGDGQFVAVVGWNGTIVTSQDGESWVPQTAVTSDDLEGVAWGGNQFVAVGGSWPNGPIILTSPDGATWTSQRPNIGGEFDRFRDVTWGENRFVAVGDSELILTSFDGVNWTTQSGISLSNFSGITWNGSLFVAVGERYGTVHLGDGAAIYTSPDGVTWTRHVSGYDGEIGDIAWGNGQFVALGVEPAEGAVLTSRTAETGQPRASVISSLKV